MGSEAMPEHVRSNAAVTRGQTAAARALFDAQPEGHGREGSAAFGQKDVGRRFSIHEVGPPRFQIAFEGSDRFFSNRYDAFFVAFTDDVDKAGFEVELFEPDCAQLSEAQAGSVSELEHGLVA